MLSRVVGGVVDIVTSLRVPVRCQTQLTPAMADHGRINEEPVDNMLTMQCRYCRGIGHSLRDCPKPRDYPRVDYSKIQCHKCGMS